MGNITSSSSQWGASLPFGGDPSPAQGAPKKLVVEEFDHKKQGQLYDVTKELGQGAFGVVRMATRRTDSRVVALKDIKKKQLDAQSEADLITEVRIMQEIAAAAEKEPAAAVCLQL